MLYAWVADVVRTLLPRAVAQGITSADVVDIETLETRLRQAASESNSQLEFVPQIWCVGATASELMAANAIGPIRPPLVSAD